MNDTVPRRIAISEQSGSTRQVTYPGLRRFNGVMSVLHLAQGALMLVTGLTVDRINAFRLPITTSYLAYDTALQRLVTQTREVARLPIGVLVSSFLFLSAIAHLLIVLPRLNQVYNRNLDRGINHFRWFEYALSSSVMIALIAMLFGVYDLATLVLIAGANATMNLFGLMMELHNQSSERTRWGAFVMGCFIGAFPWAVILMYFLGSGKFASIPWFVYAILGSYFVFFNLFPVNMVLQYRRVGRWANYLVGERGYIILSLVAKSVLAWLVFAGTMQPA